DMPAKNLQELASSLISASADCARQTGETGTNDGQQTARASSKPAVTFRIGYLSDINSKLILPYLSI
ncbi:MAG: hypothetical protein AB1403_22920, partial [Candidatus Riflebacteria bacterium]